MADAATAPDGGAGISRSERRLRRFVLMLAALVFAVSIIELLFEEHTKEALQLIPFGLCAAGFAVVIAALVLRGRRVRTMLYVVMSLVAAGALLGVYLHTAGNIEFEREISPSASSGDVVWNGLHGASPLLAPGILLLAAALAVAGVYGADRTERT